jgi:hypothetical protein
MPQIHHKFKSKFKNSIKLPINSINYGDLLHGRGSAAYVA